jgi:membrane-bound serine protease (ClpP class)
MMFKGIDPDLKLSWRVLLPTLILVSGFFVFVAGLVFRAQISQPKTGSKGLVGEIGIVKKALTPEGKVFVHGELWNARSDKTVEEDVKVRIVNVVNLMLEVEPADESSNI